METGERDERGSGRSQNVVHTLPRSMGSVPQFLTGPLERIDPAAGATQLLVVTADSETAVVLAEAVLRMTGPAGIELLPVTTARRARRLMSGRPVLALAGAPRDIRDLVTGSQLKLDSVKSVVLAWADEILSGSEDDVAALEAIMNELPKDAARIVVTSRNEGRVNAFAERYLRRARREAEPDEQAQGEPISMQYVTVSRGSRIHALRRLLDEMDPPSAAIVVSDESSGNEVAGMLRMLGYHEGSAAVRVTREEIEPSTYAVIFYDAPATRAQIVSASQASPVSLVALVDAHELSALKRIGGDTKPFMLSAAGNAAREREAAVRRELTNVLESGIASREVLALEPMLERFDGLEVAAAALRLLERERSLRKSQEESRPAYRAPDRQYADRRPATGDRRPFGDRRPSDRRPASGDRRPSDRRPASGDRRPSDRRGPPRRDRP